MKKYILITSLFILAQLVTKAQTAQPVANNDNVAFVSTHQLLQNSLADDAAAPDSYDHYMQQCHTFRIVGLSLLGVGVVSSVAALVYTGSDNYKNGNGNASAVLFVIGGAAGIASIPFMIMAHARKNKAKMSLKNQKTGWGLPANVNGNITGITLSLPIGK